jgi:Uma2 family endonuclease
MMDTISEPQPTTTHTPRGVIGPLDHGQRVSEASLAGAEFREGYRYEIIHGRLAVAAASNMSHEVLLAWLRDLLVVYRINHSSVMNFVASSPRVFVPDAEGETIPEPDLACYRDFDPRRPLDEQHWQTMHPFLVVEVLSPDSLDKDLRRNVDLYLRVPSIQEYWIVDAVTAANRPGLRVLRRSTIAWAEPLDLPFGSTYTTPLLPGLELLIDPYR